VYVDSENSMSPMFCGPTVSAAAFMYQSFEYIKFVSYCLIPFMTILSLNVSIVVRLRWTAPALRNNRQTVTSYRSRNTSQGMQRIALVDRTTSSGQNGTYKATSTGPASALIDRATSSGEESQNNGTNNVCSMRSVVG